MTTSFTPAQPGAPIGIPNTALVSTDPFAGLTEVDASRIAAAMTATIADSEVVKVVSAGGS